MNFFLNIGSNIGNREANLSRAITLLKSLSSVPLKLSDIVESEPWGFDSENRFLNVAVLLVSDRDPHDMLRQLQAIEREMGSECHRTPSGDYADRLIDIDIMAIDNLVINSPSLIVPHPHLHDRPFFLMPYRQLLEDSMQD